MFARSQENLVKVRAEILSQAPSAKLLVASVDVRDTLSVAEFVRGTVEKFGRIDILVPNAGAMTPLTQLLADKDADAFWNTFEVNVKGVYNIIRASMPYLQETNGRIIAVGSNAAQLRIQFCSDYCTSKFALQRLIEFVALEYPNIKSFVLHPGAVIATGLGEKNYDPDAPAFKGLECDTVALPAATILHLAAGKADWLHGRFVSARWDLGEVERDWKEKILEGNALVCKLAIP